MKPSSFISLSAFALRASAFLLPFDVAPSAVAPTSGVPHVAQDIRVMLSCDHCPFAQKKEDGDLTWANDVENVLVLNFHASEGNIYLNDHLFYPANLPFDSLYAPQALSFYDENHVKDFGPPSEPLLLCYVLEYAQAVAPTDNSGVEIIPIHFTITRIGPHNVDLPTLTLQALKSHEGDIMLTDVNIVRAPPAPINPTNPNQCTTQLCRLKAIFLAQVAEIQAKLDKAKGKLPTGKISAWGKKGCSKFRFPHRPGGEREDHRRPPHPHDGKMRHHRHRGIMHIVVHVLRFLVVPILLGIAGGLVASAIGMVLGQAIVLFWIRYGRHGRRGSVGNARVEEAVEEDEKDALVSEELPPQYEELEATDKVVLEQK